MDTTKLLHLLAKNQQNPIARQLLQEFPDRPAFAVTGPIPIENVRSIYRLRSIRNENLGEPIKGFPELVQGLNSFTGDSISIYSIDTDTIMYKVFADAARGEFAGTLKFPQSAIVKRNAFAQPELQAA